MTWLFVHSKWNYHSMVVESQFSYTRREYPARSCTLCPTFCSLLERLDQVMPPHDPCCKAGRNRKCDTYPELSSRLGYQTPEGCTLQDLRVSNISNGALGNNNVDVSTFPCNSIPPSGLSLPVNITHCQASLHTILSLIVTHWPCWDLNNNTLADEVINSKLDDNSNFDVIFDFKQVDRVV